MAAITPTPTTANMDITSYHAKTTTRVDNATIYSQEHVNKSDNDNYSKAPVQSHSSKSVSRLFFSLVRRCVSLSTAVRRARGPTGCAEYRILLHATYCL